MKKIIRLFVLGVFAAIGLLVASIAIFLAVFDANEYKQELSELALAQTGRDLQFHGDISLTLFPALGMKLGALSISNAAGFGSQPMIKVKEVSISVDLASLIAFSPEIDRLVLRDLDVNLIRNKVGVSNWDDLLSKTEGEVATGAETAPAAASETAGMELKGAFGGLDLQNIRVLWLDEQAGEQITINDLDISTGRIVPEQPFELSLQLDANSTDAFNINLDLKTNVLFQAGQERLSLTDLMLKLNEFEITGQVEVSHFARPAVRFDLASQNLDLDVLLAKTLAQGPAADTAADAADPAAPAPDTRIELPLETLRELDIDGKIVIAQFWTQKLQMSDFSLTLKADRGLVSIDPLSMKLYSGSAKVRVEIDANGAVARYKVNKLLEQVQVGDLLRDFDGSDIISGSLNANVDLTTRGEWVSELKQNSNGSMNLAFIDGALKGFNIRHSIDRAKAKFRNQAPPPETALKTDFSALSLSGRIVNGVFSSDDLDMQAPLLRVGGKGSVNLVNNSLDYLVNAKVVGTVEGQQGEVSDQLKGVTIPVRIKGPFDAPKIDVQLDELLKGKVDAEKAKLRAEIEKQKAALEAQIEAEKKALAESRKRELGQQIEIEKARQKAELEKKKEEAKKKLLEKLVN